VRQGARLLLMLTACLGLLLPWSSAVRQAPALHLNTQTEQNLRFVDDEYASFTQVARLPLIHTPRREAWQEAAPGVVEIGIPRASGERDQPALWYHSGTPGKKPLLLVLHSWKANHLQHYGIPYGVFAVTNDWIFIHPDFRGPFENAEATASEKVVQDILDALAYAKAHAPVDEDRIYVAGFSGGAMMSLIMVGRHPELFTAALAWVPIHDLNDWYASLDPSRLPYTFDYRADIESSCGGDPLADAAARAECGRRSPSAYLANARGKGVSVFIGGGIQDPFVPPSHAIRAFNELAEEDQKIGAQDYQFIDQHKRLPEGLEDHHGGDPLFEQARLPVVFKRASGDATLILFRGGHDIAYNAGLEWLARQRR
jgi:predicted esterase